MIAKMSLEEKVGQMFFARCPDENAAETAAQYHLGGYVLFGRDFENLTADEVRENIQSYQDASKVPMLIGVDEEGGEVNRVSLYLRDTPFLSPKEYYADGGWEAVTAAETEKVVVVQFHARVIVFVKRTARHTVPTDIQSVPRCCIRHGDRVFDGFVYCHRHLLLSDVEIKKRLLF